MPQLSRWEKKAKNGKHRFGMDAAFKKKKPKTIVIPSSGARKRKREPILPVQPSITN